MTPKPNWSLPPDPPPSSGWRPGEILTATTPATLHARLEARSTTPWLYGATTPARPGCVLLCRRQAAPGIWEVEGLGGLWFAKEEFLTTL